MNMTALDNPNPIVKARSAEAPSARNSLQQRVFDQIRDIRDPEHPHSLEELSVVDVDSVAVQSTADDSPGFGRIDVTFTPTVPHCSLASIIGLSIQLKLRQSPLLSPPGDRYYKLRVRCAEGAHATADDINRQLSDKERVAAAFENPRIVEMLNSCINNLPG